MGGGSMEFMAHLTYAYTSKLQSSELCYTCYERNLLPMKWCLCEPVKVFFI